MTLGGEVRAHFADGTTATGDLLVAADGVGSRVREQHLPDVGRRWPTGRVTLLGDANHAGPVNGTGANAALRDAALLCWNLVRAERGGASLHEAVHDYEVEMLRSARATRAATDALQGRPGARTGPQP